MTPIASMVAKMLEAGTPHDAIILAIETAEQVMDVRGMSADKSADISAERRRSADRERKRLARLSAENLRKSAESAECPMSVSTVSITKVEASKEVKKDRGRGYRLSADWKPTQADINFAVSHAWSEARIELEATKFRNHWTSKTGRDATKLDWGRTWQNWVLNARTPNGAGFSPHRSDSTAGPAPSNADAILAGMGRVAAKRREAREANGGWPGDGNHGAAGKPDADGEPEAGDGQLL